MKIFAFIILIFLSGCQTLGTLGFIEEDPREPKKVDRSFPTFASERWSKIEYPPLINFQSEQDKYIGNHLLKIVNNQVFRLKDNSLIINNISNGRELSEFVLESNTIVSGISVGYQTFVYSNSEGDIYAHELSDGSIRWKKSLQDLVISEVLITSKSVFVQTSSDVLYSINLRDGEIEWTKSAQSPLLSIRGTASPYFYEGLIFSSFSNGRLAAIRSTDGIQLWEKPISILKGSTELEKLMDSDTTPIAFDESVYVANFNGSLTRFDIRSGEKVFSVDFSTSEDLIIYRDLIIGQSNDDEIIAFDAINGTKRWSNENFMFRNLSSINLLNGKLYFGDLDGYLHEVDASTGEILGITRTSLGAINQVVLNDEFIAASDFSGKIKIFEIF